MMSGEPLPDTDQCISDAEDAWRQSGDLIVFGRVVPQNVLGACAAQLGPICTNGVDFFLEVGLFMAGGRSGLLQFPVAWSILGSAEGAWLSARVASMVPRDLVEQGRAVGDWACGMSAEAAEQANSDWWELHDLLWGQLEAYARALLAENC